MNDADGAAMWSSLLAAARELVPLKADAFRTDKPSLIDVARASLANLAERPFALEVLAWLEPEVTLALFDDVVRIVREYADWLAKSPMPKLFVNAEPGSILVGAQREFCRTWANQTEVTVRGNHFVQEDSPDEIGRALANFVRRA